MQVHMAFDGRTSVSAQAGDRIPALDLLRLVAVLGVIAFHYGFRGPPELRGGAALPELAWFARYGYLGVPVFFVISGFVIAFTANGRTAAGFAIARIARIYPGFIFCMTLTSFSILAFGVSHFETSFVQWAANLFIAAPALNQPYTDSAYWSLVVEVTFYAWVISLMTAGLFPRRIDAIVLVWLSISMLNELTIDSRLIERIILSEDSGFFAAGLLIYELYRGRRNTALQWLLALSIATAVFQAVHNLGRLRDDTGAIFDGWIVAIVCIVSILVVIRATRIRQLPLPAGVIIGAGGLTYPLYLLHQKIGYVALYWIGPVAHPAVLVSAIVIAIMLLSWAMWRYVEKPCQRLTKQVLTDIAASFGQTVRSRAVPAQDGLLRGRVARDFQATAEQRRAPMG